MAHNGRGEYVLVFAIQSEVDMTVRLTNRDDLVT